MKKRHSLRKIAALALVLSLMLTTLTGCSADFWRVVKFVASFAPEETDIPAAEATAVPAVEATAVPTAVPTAEPTAVSTIEPTAQPVMEEVPEFVEETQLLLYIRNATLFIGSEEKLLVTVL